MAVTDGDGSFSIMSKGQVHPCDPDVAWPHDLIYSLKTGPGIMPPCLSILASRIS